MKKIIFLLFVLFSLSSCFNVRYLDGDYTDKNNAPYISRTFEDPEFLPKNIIISELYMEKHSSIFFIYQDKTSSYSKLTEYSTEEGKDSKEILAFKENEGRISEYDNNDEYIVFGVKRKIESKLYKDIYLYRMETGELKKIKKDIYVGQTYDTYNYQFVTLFQNKVYWLSTNFEAGQTELTEYDIASGKEETIIKRPFLKTGAMEQCPIKFLTHSENYLIYNALSDDSNESIVFYDVKGRKPAKNIIMADNIKYSFYAVCDDEENNLYLYSSDDKKEYIVKVDMEGMKCKKLTKFDSRSFVIDDKIRFSDGYIIYPVELYYTGNSADNYYCDVFNLKKDIINRYCSVFSFVKSRSYFGYLKIDDKLGYGKLYFKLYRLSN